MMDKLKEPQFIIAAAIIVLALLIDLVCIWVMVRHNLTTVEATTMGSILGVWNTGMTAGWSYWIGSSHSSQQKDATIQKLSTNGNGKPVDIRPKSDAAPAEIVKP